MIVASMRAFLAVAASGLSSSAALAAPQDGTPVEPTPKGIQWSTGDYTWRVAGQTRFNVEVTGPTTAGPFKAFVEGDFFSDQNAFRLRHAYGTVGEVLGGQTWTTFMDEDAMPETIDFESPIAFPIVRQAQIRW